MDSKKAKQRLNKTGGLHTKPNLSQYPHALFARALEESLLKREGNLKIDGAEVSGGVCQPGAGDVNNSIIITGNVRERRRWLHRLRLEAGQDEALMDYKTIDPELTLDWEYLTKPNPNTTGTQNE